MEKENKFNQGWRDGIRNKHSGSEDEEYQNGFDHGRQFEKRRYWEEMTHATERWNLK